MSIKCSYCGHDLVDGGIDFFCNNPACDGEKQDMRRMLKQFRDKRELEEYKRLKAIYEPRDVAKPHPDDRYIPAPGHEGPAPTDLETAHVRHDNEVWTDGDSGGVGTWICNAANFETAQLIARLLRNHKEN